MVSPGAAENAVNTELRVAVIAAVASLAGALVGGATSYLANRDLQSRDAARQDRLVTAAARTGAALELHRLGLVAQAADIMSSERIRVRLDPDDVRPRLTNEQLAALVGTLDFNDSAKYQSAVECATRIRGFRRHIDDHIALALQAETRCIRDGNVVLRGLIRRSGRS
jgi:hypothetical protein